MISPNQRNLIIVQYIFIMKVRGKKASATESISENQCTCTPLSTEPRDWLRRVMCVDFLPAAGVEQGRPSVLAAFGPSALLIRMSKLISFTLIHQQGRDWNCTRPP